ncbi:MAG: hypothetical protein H0W87_00855 [Actinobacteria bacterium]|nr:hypothetical protein [Actinomycetota bacterium]
MTRQVERGSRTWIVRSYRFSWPPWRAFWPEAETDGLFWSTSLTGFLINLVFAPFTLLVIPLLVFPIEAAGRGVFALASNRRQVDAAPEGEPPILLRWVTDAAHEEAVVEQIAHQLALGYPKIEPHRARFLGFS